LSDAKSRCFWLYNRRAKSLRKLFDIRPEPGDAHSRAPAIDYLAERGRHWVLNLTPAKARRRSGTASSKFWLRSLSQKVWLPTWDHLNPYGRFDLEIDACLPID